MRAGEMMKERILGKTGIKMTELGYGCTAQFGKKFFGKQNISDHQALSLISAALDSGIRFFDTGYNYGYAEERLGKCLSTIFRENGICKREDIVIQTKGCETPDGSYEYSPDWIKKSVEISLKRLQLDYIDLYALHKANPGVLSDKLFYLFEDLKHQGIIRAYGVCGISDDFGEWIIKHQCFDYIMMTYNYAEAGRNTLIEKLYDSKIGILAGGSLNRSLNTIKRLPHNRNDLWYLLRALGHYRGEFNKARKFKFMKDIEGMTPQQVSLAYIMRNNKVTSALFNTINPDHLRENVRALDMELPQEIVDKIERNIGS